jgi:pimeloyl-ACP methyl ester carboxylesterase
MPQVKEHFSNSFDGETLYIKEKSPEDDRSSMVILCLTPCVYPHQVFDCPVSDYSLMDYLVEKGFRVFAYDPRGFGNSYHPQDGKDVTFEVEFKDAEALVKFVVTQSGSNHLSFVAIGVGTALACGLAASHPEMVESVVMMDFVWKVLPIPIPAQFKEMVLAKTRGYLQMDLLNPFFDNVLFRFFAPEILSWIHSTFTEAPAGPFLATFEPLPLVKSADLIRASVMIIRGTKAEVTSEEDGLDFLSTVKAPIRVFNAIQGAGAVPHLEKNYYKQVFEDIAWFFSR